MMLSAEATILSDASTATRLIILWLRMTALQVRALAVQASYFLRTASMRSCISSGERSSLCVAIHQ